MSVLIFLSLSLSLTLFAVISISYLFQKRLSSGYPIADDVYRALYRLLSEDIPWKELSSPSEIKAYQKKISGRYKIMRKTNPLNGNDEERIVEINRHRIVPKTSEIDPIIKHYFSEYKGLGAKKLSVVISRQYSSMGEKLVRRHLDKMKENQRRKPLFSNKAPLRPVLSKYVMNRIQIDLVSFLNVPVEIDEKKYCYALSVIDIFSRFLWLRPLCDKGSHGVARRLRKIFMEHGCPKIIHCDNGGEFKKMVQRLAEMLNVKIIRGRPYHPQTQGKVSVKLVCFNMC